MSIKDLFSNYNSKQFSSAQSELSASKLVESNEFIQNKHKDRNTYEPPIDFSTASNFAKFGSAELYYEYAFKRIYQQYPYDGTLAEQQEFHNNSTFLDRYVFNNVYPRTTGHILFSSEGWGTRQGSLDNGYGLSNNLQYISVLGGPHTASSGMVGKKLLNTFDNSMIYDVSKGRVGSFEWNPASGSTIEFWMKKGGWGGGSTTRREVVLDIWNGETDTSDPTYGRIRLELYNDNANTINLTMWSGSVGFQNQAISPSTLDMAAIADNQWHHYAVSIKSATDTTIDLYRDGAYLNTTTVSSKYIGPIKNVAGGVNAYIGALQTTAKGTSTTAGYGKLSASLDEFRYWKKKRTTNEIGEYWFINMGGGTNKREYNTDLGVYFKFNEGITGDAQKDSIMLDYSGRISNGIMVGYSANARSTDSALESIVNVEEYKDPIIYASHPDVSSSLATYKATGSIQDYENTSLLYNLMPSWMTEEDYENGQNLRYLNQIMASYFDTLNAQIEGIVSVKDKRYLSGSFKPNVFSRQLLRNQGFVVPEIFIEADILEELRGKDNNEIYNDDLQEIKNLIYQNIYNNLEYIYKSKGTEKSFRNLFRCFGVDSELIKINLYSDDSTYLFKDNYEYTSIAKPVLNFNTETQVDASVYTVPFISGSEADDEEYTSLTLEFETIFPHKVEPYQTGYFTTGFISASIGGFHRPRIVDADDYTFADDDTYLRIYALKNSIDSKDVTFLLTGSGIELTSSLYTDVYNNNKWILAARVKNEKYPFAGDNFQGTTNANYIVEFFGVNSVANDVKNEFTTTATISNTEGKKLLGRAKRVYTGARRQHFTSSTVLEKTDVKISQVRLWQSYLDNDVIKQHSFDPTNYGLHHPYRSDTPNQVPDLDVPQIDTLALHWNFSMVTASNASGEFDVFDISSGSSDEATKYSFLGEIVNNKNNGYGIGFDASSVNVVDKEFIYAAKKRMPDEVYSSDGVNIKSELTEQFFEDDKVSDHFYSFEKSPYNAVSQQMINFFGTIKDFNSLVGDPAERYRMEYKQMNDLKNLFFRKVENTPDPERFFEYFKWIDTSISYAIKQLIPAGSKFSEDVKDVVESHILERNKYQEKFPLTAQQTSTEGIVKSYSEMFYNWRFGHAPVDGSDNRNCLWQKTRKKVDNAQVQSLRENIYKTSNLKLDKLFDTVTQQVYQGNTDAIRRLSRPYRLNMDLSQNIHGGTNYYVAKNRDFVLEVLHPHGPTTADGVPKNVLVVGVGAGQGLIAETVCEDEKHPLNKEKYKFDGVDGRFSTNQLNAPVSEFAGNKNFIKGIAKFPMNIMSQSATVSTGYQAEVSSSFSNTAYITNLHSDTTDRTNVIPMQGPFTERHVGGHQSRHVSINKYDINLRDDETGNAPTNNIDNIYTRPEAWRLLLGENPNNAITDGALGFTPPDYGVDAGTGSYPDTAKKRASFYREEKAKRPVNIKNIKHSQSGSVVGNYNNNYEFLMLQGRRENNLYFRDNPELTNYLPVQYTSSLPHTTHVMSLVGIDPVVSGNVFGTHTNNMQPDAQMITPGIPGTPANGSFSVSGSTVNGIAAAGSVRLIREVAAATPAKFSFDVSGSHFAGTNASGSFSFTRSTSPAVSASIQFTAKGRTIEQVEASGSFVVTGSRINAAAATASFDVAGLPVGGERSYAIFDVGFQNVHDGHTFNLGRAGATTGLVEVEIHNDGITSGNHAVTPYQYQKATLLSGSTTYHYTGSVEADSEISATLSFYVYLTDPAITGNGTTKYIYQSFGNYSASKFSDPQPVMEVFFPSGTNDLYVRHYFKNSADQLGYYQRVWTTTIPAGWMQITVLSKTEARELNFAINGTQVANGMTDNLLSLPITQVHPTHHKIMGDGTGTWGANVRISDFIYWNARTGSGGSDTDIIGTIYRNGIRPPDNTFLTSQMRHWYSFGDGGGTVQHPTDRSSPPRVHLTSSWTPGSEEFADSNFVIKKTATQFFNEVTAALEQNSNSTYFDVNYIAYTSASTEDFTTQWPATSSTAVISPTGLSEPFPINSGYSLDFARFYVVASSENATSNYQIAPVITTGSFTNELSMSFRNLTFDGTGSAQQNSTTNSIEDTSITIDGTVISFNHHSNSQGGNQVRTHATSYNPCLSGSSFGASGTNLNNSSYPSAGSLISTSDISISLWHARSSTNTQQEYLILLDSTGGGTIAGAISIRTTNTNIYIDAYQNSSVYKRFTATFSSLGINEDDLNHYVFTFDISSLTGVLYVNGVAKSLTTSGTATSFSHTFTEIRLANGLGGGIYELQGRLCQVSIWDKVLTATEAHEIYHDGRIKDLYGHSSAQNLVHWYKLGTEDSWPSVGSDLSSFTTVPDSTPRYQKVDLTVNGPTNFSSQNGLPDNTVSNSTFWSSLNSSIDSNVTDYNASNTDGAFVVTNTSTGPAGNGDSLSEDSDLISNLEATTTGGVNTSGVTDGHAIEIDGVRFELDTASDGVSSGQDINCGPGVSNTDFWNALSQSIIDNTDFDTISIVDNGNGSATFSLTASTGGAANNGRISSSDSSFSSIVNSAGGVTQSGSVDGHYVVLAASSGAGEQKKFIIETSDGTQSDDTPTGSFYVDSSVETDVEFWNNLSQSIKDRGFGVSYTGGSGQATFTVTSYKTGSSGNTAYDSSTSGTTFASVAAPFRFGGGNDIIDNNDTNTFTLDGTTFEMDSNGSITGGRTAIASSASLTNTQIFDNITTSIISNTVFDTVSYSVIGSTATFSVTSSVTGTVKNNSITASTGFSVISQATGGSNTSGSQYADTLVIGNHGSDVTITIDDGTNGSSLFANASLSSALWWNDLSQSIKDNTNYDTITIVDNGDFATFQLTSSVAAAAGNDNHSETGTTFFNVANSTGGSDAGDSSDGSSITIDGVSFVLDSDGSYTGDHNIASSASLSDNAVFNALTQSIKDNTIFDTIVMNPTSGNNRVLSLTSSVTGSDKNSVFASASGDFSIVVNSAGGTNETGATDGHTITIGGVTFELDNNSSVIGGNRSVNCEDALTNTQFWNLLSQSIIDHTVYDTVSYDVAAGIATFELTSSTTGSALNVAISRTGDSFSVIRGMQDGSNAIPAVFSLNDVVLAVPTPTLRNGDRNKTIISSRFAAPGGIEIESNAYLDIYARELSVHNALPFRNLTVRGKKIRTHEGSTIGGSGEENQIRVTDHLGKRRGLNTLLALHSGQFGVDNEYGSIVESTYSTSGSFNKQHRNRSKRMQYSGSSIITGSLFDNGFVSSPIPRSEFQYSWIRNSLSASGYDWEADQRILGYQDSNGVVLEKTQATGKISLAYLSGENTTIYDTHIFTITINDGSTTITFELTRTHTVAAGNVAVTANSGFGNAASLMGVPLRNAINNSALNIVASSGAGMGVVDLTHELGGAFYNIPIIATSTNSGVQLSQHVSGMSSGKTNVLEAIVFPSSSNIT